MSTRVVPWATGATGRLDLHAASPDIIDLGDTTGFVGRLT